jgi:hypothetical protein
MKIYSSFRENWRFDDFFSVSYSMNWLQKISMGLWEDIEKYGPPKRENDYKHPLPNWWQFPRFSGEFGYSAPTKEAIQKIKQFVGDDQVLEVGAGKGLWAKLMQDAGIKVTPTDIAAGKTHGTDEPSIVSTENEHYTEETRQILRDEHKDLGPEFSYDFDPNTYTDVYKTPGEDAVAQFGDHAVLMLNYPPYDNPMAANVLKLFQGNKVIYIGEGMGGATADDEFHEILRDQWTSVGGSDLPYFHGTHPYAEFYIRK